MDTNTTEQEDVNILASVEPQGINQSPKKRILNPVTPGFTAPIRQSVPEPAMAPKPAETQAVIYGQGSPQYSQPEPVYGAGDTVSGDFGTETKADMDDLPNPVVQVLSVRGVEFVMMTLTLWFGVGSLAWIILSLINGFSRFSVLAFPIALLLVSLPVFATLFFRLKRAELANPELRFDPSKRRWSQRTQILGFLVCIINVAAFIYTAIVKVSGQGSGNIVKAFFSLVVVLILVGGVLAYYWFDEHRLTR